MTGRVHSVETMGTLEGPGLRYVLFLQGCPLRCKFCHNPDTWARSGGSERSVREIVSDVWRYRDFLRSSGGGVTVTGGEPLLQAGFVAELFASLQERGLHTALDTSGFAELTPEVRAVLEHTDLLLLDLKHSDAAAHRELTGVDPGRIWDFARYASASGIRIWVRHVLVPGHTLDRGTTLGIAELIRGLSGVDRVDLLPYHELGRHKWEAMGMDYPLPDVHPPAPQAVRDAWQIFSDAGLPVTPVD